MKRSTLSRTPGDELRSFMSHFRYLAQQSARCKLMASAPRASKHLAFLAAVSARAASIFPLGITARLSIPLIAVAVLGAAANMIARESISVISMSAPTSFPAPPSVTLPQLPALPTLVEPSMPAQVTVVRSTAPSKRSIEALTSAVDRYSRASQLRAAVNSPENEAEYLSAQSALRNSPLDYGKGAPPRTAPSLAVGRRTAEYLDRGQALVRVGDQRRSARTEHSMHSEAIDKELQQSLDGAWKIFGRVMARQSLLQLRTELNTIRQRSENIVSGDAVSAADIDLLAASENIFAANLEAHRKSLEKSDGVNWVRSVRENFDALVVQRASLYALNVQYDDEVQRFSSAHLSISAAINAASEASESAVVGARPRPPAAPRSIAPSSPPNPQHADATSLVDATPRVNTTSPDDATSAVDAARPVETTPAVESTALDPHESDRRTRHLMAMLTIVVILFITAISVLTVRSVLAPVRRILKATAEVARGNMRIEVTRGGIRELDTLAGAFNEMAERLAAAQTLSRNQHESLEATVLERTHQLQKLAQQDPLTSLPNRRHLSALLGAAIDNAGRDGRYVGVYFLDIDNFKNFNDSLGHVFGDRVLMSVANRLEEIADGLGFVARLGGDEFTLVYEDAMSVEAIEDVGWSLVQAFHKLVSVDARELSISVSVGASIFPEHGRDADGLLRAADSALFRAKELGRSQLAVFTPELTETAATRFTIEQGLRRALQASEFELAYQPEIDLATSEIGLVEALLRWRMPDGRLAKPGDFLAVAEQSGLIAEINTWVLRTAVKDASRWYHGGWPEARVAINISPRQLLDQRFVDHLLALLLEHRLPAKCIELELTESLLQTGPTTISALRILQSHGFGIALDDFGTGYSSLTSLEQLPLSRIKLDRSLVASIDTSDRAAAIARAIIDLCGSLGLQVTAEGIERPQQFAWLMGNRDMFLQGYLLSDAVSFDEVLSVKASLGNKIQDLLMSLPVPHHRRALEATVAKAIVNG